MRSATTISISIAVALLLTSAQAFGGIRSSSARPNHGMAVVQVRPAVTASASTFLCMSSPLDGLNRDMLNNKDDDDDDDKPMTKAEMKAEEKEMKAEMKRLKDEAAAAAKKDE
jgi:hypothetical protein